MTASAGRGEGDRSVRPGVATPGEAHRRRLPVVLAGASVGAVAIALVLLIGLAVGVVLLGLFLWRQIRTQDAEPLLPFAVFSDRTFTVMTLVLLAMGFAMVGVFLPMTIYYQSVLGLTAVAAEHFVAAEAEDFLRGKPATDENFSKAAKIAAENCHPVPDQRGPEDYKRHLVAELTTRALRRAASRAAGRAAQRAKT